MDIRSAPFVPINTRLSRDELLTIVNIAPTYVRQEMDILSAIWTLFSLGMIQEDDKKVLLCKYSSSTDLDVNSRFLSFFIDILNKLSFADLVWCLRQFGFTTFAAALEQRSSTAFPLVMQGADIPSSNQLLRFHSSLKSKLDNNEFVDKVKALNELDGELLRKLNRRRGTRARQLIADCYATVVWLEVHMYRDENVERKISALDKMITSIPVDVILNFATMVYLGRAAIAYALSGDWDTAMRYVIDAQGHIINCKESFAKTLVCHDVQYVYRLRQAAFNTSDDAQNVVKMCDLGLQSVAGRWQSDKLVWERLFKLWMAQSLLGVMPKLVVDLERDIVPISKATAKSLVSQISSIESFTGIESRREMVYSLCQSLIHGEEGNMDMAMAFANRAAELTKSGSFFSKEKDNILDYRKQLYHRLTPIQEMPICV